VYLLDGCDVQVCLLLVVVLRTASVLVVQSKMMILLMLSKHNVFSGFRMQNLQPKLRKDFMCIMAKIFAEAVCCVIQTKKSDRSVMNEETVSQVKMCISQSPSPTVDLCIFMHTCKSY
jgi:hypothetical protein